MTSTLHIGSLLTAVVYLLHGMTHNFICVLFIGNNIFSLNIHVP